MGIGVRGCLFIAQCGCTNATRACSGITEYTHTTTSYNAVYFRAGEDAKGALGLLII